MQEHISCAFKQARQCIILLCKHSGDVADRALSLLLGCLRPKPQADHWRTFVILEQYIIRKQLTNPSLKLLECLPFSLAVKVSWCSQRFLDHPCQF